MCVSIFPSVYQFVYFVIHFAGLHSTDAGASCFSLREAVCRFYSGLAFTLCFIALLEGNRHPHTPLTHTDTPASISQPPCSPLILIHIFSRLPRSRVALAVFSCFPSGGCSPTLPPRACDVQIPTHFWEKSFFLFLSLPAFLPPSLPSSLPLWEAL